jgi:hypothetical protein
MRTLEDSWKWYTDNRRLLQLMSRMGRLYWNKLPWDDMGNDDHFRMLEGIDIQADADAVLSEFDDLAIFVIFSVFEAIVRDHVANDVEAEVAGLKHVALQRAASKMKQNIEEGSFYNNVLDLYKKLDHDLVEEVSQVRRYRNWVAHGRRKDKKPFETDPKEAFDRLNAFLTASTVTPQQRWCARNGAKQLRRL